MLQQFAALLRVRSNLPEQKIKVTVTARLVGIGFGETCGRCGGSGSYSFNLMDGTKCYGCNGYGEKPPKLTKALLAKVTEAVSAGKLETYFTDLRNRQTVKAAYDTVFKTWTETGISDRYDWHLAASHGHFVWAPEDRRIADINAKMCAVVDRIKTQTRSVDTKRLTSEQAAEIADAVQAAVIEIKTIALEMDAPHEIEQPTAQHIALLPTLRERIAGLEAEAATGHYGPTFIGNQIETTQAFIAVLEAAAAVRT